MIDIVRDIAEIVKDDKEHYVKVEIEWSGVKVYLDYDPDKNFSQNIIIPIELDLTSDFCYIPDWEYREKFNPADYGITLDEIVLVKKIMEYLEVNITEIREVCRMLDLDYTEDKNNE